MPLTHFIVLLAEDNATDEMLFRRALKKAGITSRLEVAMDGQQAIDYLAGEKEYADREKFPLPHLLILDIKMPKRSGLEVLRWLREQPEYTGLPVVMLTSSDLDRDILEAYQLGANGFFRKPLAIDKTERLVRVIYDYWANALVPKRRRRNGLDN